MKVLLILLFCLSFRSVAMAESNVAFVLLSSGDLSIQIIDDPNSSTPYVAAELWSLMKKGATSRSLHSKNLLIDCQTLVTDPSSQRFGSCSLKISRGNFENSLGRLLVAVHDPEILSELNEGSVRLVKEKATLTVNHRRQSLFISIADELVSK